MTTLKYQQEQARIEGQQFVFGLNPHTLLSIDMAAPVVGKSPATFRSDVTRRPETLPRLTRLGRRVFVRVEDLLAFISPSAKPARRFGQS